MNWIYLIIAGIFEVVWAVGLKYCDGLRINLGLTVVVIATIGSMFFLSLAMRSIPTGTSYAIWTGIGILGVSIYGIIFFNEQFSIAHVVFLTMILVGIIGLKIITK